MPDPDESSANLDSSKIYKITYSINLLPSICPYIEENEMGKKTKINEDKDFI